MSSSDENNKSFVQPFRGVRFSEKAGEISKLMAPPYDVISDDYRNELYDRSENNIVRISKSREINDEKENDQYQKASQIWKKWRDEGMTIRDEEPSFYLYEQEFEIQSKTYHRLGVVCAHKLVEFGEGVLPHEKTLSGPKVDRLRLLNQTKTHFGQIFGLYADENGSVDAYLRQCFAEEKLVYEGKDDDGLWHRVKRVSVAEKVKKISELFQGKEMIIADGHHRYETALKYSKEMGTKESSYLMMTAVSLANPGLLILPTHRLVKNVEDFNVEFFLNRARANFDVREFIGDETTREKMKKMLLDSMEIEFKKGQSAHGFYAGNNRFILLVRKEDCMPKVMGSELYRKLDVVVLHKMLLEDILRIDEVKLAEQSNVEYIKDTGNAIDESLKAVDSGSHQCVFLMNPTPMDQTQGIAEKGEKMPQKSTFFYPKVFTGLVTYQIEDGVV